MNRRSFLSATATAAATPLLFSQQPQPLTEPHFPDRLHQFVWRNWELVESRSHGHRGEGRGTQARAAGPIHGAPRKNNADR